MKNHPKGAAEKLKEAHDQLAQAREQLLHSEKLSAIGRLASSIAHELRNPLGVINSSVQFCLEKLSPEDKIREHMEVIRRNVQQANKIIGDLLDFAKPQQMELVPVPLNLVLEDAIGLMGTKLFESGIRIEKQYPPILPEVRIDRRRLGQAFINFMLNALEAMPAGGTLFISAEVDTKHRQVMILFRDTGTGIAKEALKDLFTPFYTTKEKGVGLGLFTARRIIEAHGGKIEITSPGSGSGTAVTVLLYLT